MEDLSRLTRMLVVTSRQLRDVQGMRIQAENRVRAVNKCRFCGGKKEPKKDHECEICVQGQPCAHCEGTGLAPVQLPDEYIGVLGLDLDRLKAAEEACEKTLVSYYRLHPLCKTIKGLDGIGEVLGAQLLGMVGDLNRFRNPSSLWAYLGLGVKDGERQRRHKGEQANFKPEGQTWAYNVGEQYWHWGKNGVYGQLYKERVEAEIEKKKDFAKKRAARWVVKRMLRDLWCEATGHAVI